MAVFIFYDNTVAKLHHVSPISPSPFTTHRQNALAFGQGVLSSVWIQAAALGGAPGKRPPFFLAIGADLGYDGR